MSTANRNIHGGKKYKKTKSGNVRRKSKNPDVPVDTTTGIDHYAIVTKRLGDNGIQVKLDTGETVQAVIPGRFRRKVWFRVDDYIQVQRTSSDAYDVIQKLQNENEQLKAQAAIGKKENTEQDIFLPSIEEEDESESEVEKDEDFDAFGKKIQIEEQDEKNEKDEKEETEETEETETNIKKKDVQLTKSSVNVEKYKRKLREKERDIERRSNIRDYDEKPTSLVSDSGSDSGSD